MAAATRTCPPSLRYDELRICPAPTKVRFVTEYCRPISERYSVNVVLIIARHGAPIFPMKSYRYKRASGTRRGEAG
jgi:hypothetical protein